jgi:predicted nucleic acid-binding protein
LLNRRRRLWTAGAKVIVSRDDDLLALEKPFGIQILTPRELLTRLAMPL